MLFSAALFTTFVTISPSFGEPVRDPQQRSLNSPVPFSGQISTVPADSFIPFPSVQFSGTLVPTSVRTQPSIGSPSNFLGAFAPAFGTPVTTIGNFWSGIGSPIRRLGSF